MGKTKEEEIRAFNAIEDILDDFDPKETHVGKAFEGCVEQAEENIRNDRMLSWKGRYLEEQMKNCRLSDKVEALTKELNQKDDAIARYIDVVQGKDREIAELDGELDDKDRTYTDLEGRLEEAQRQISDLKLTIVRLKAKLYDMMTGEEVEE